MKVVNVVLMGFGRVGKAFLRVASEKRELCRKGYGLDIQFKAVFGLDRALTLIVELT